MIEALHTNPTQLTGLLVFAAAAFACMRAARTRGRPWRALALAQWACFAEILFSGRFFVHNAVDALLEGRGVYALRTPWQVALLVLALGLAALGARLALRSRGRNRDATRALVATVVEAMLFVVESISLHDVDAVMYLKLGPILAIALAWASAAMVVCISALRAARR